jgi:hypothetical protein
MHHAAPARDGADARHDLAREERLHHVVVRAELEADDPIDLIAARRQHQNRQQAALAPHRPDDVPTVDSR